MIWPDFGLPPEAQVDSLTTVQVLSLHMRPMDLHSALATLRLTVRIPTNAAGSLDLAVAPVHTDTATVRILRTHAHEKGCDASGCQLLLALTSAGLTELSFDLRIAGPRISMLPPALHVRATVVTHATGVINEATSIRVLTPQFAHFG